MCSAHSCGVRAHSGTRSGSSIPGHGGSIATPSYAASCSGESVPGRALIESPTAEPVMGEGTRVPARGFAVLGERFLLHRTMMKRETREVLLRGREVVRGWVAHGHNLARAT